MRFRRPKAACAFLFLVLLAGPARAEEKVDLLDQMLARVVGGAAGESGALYDALLKAPLYAILAEGEESPSNPSAMVLAHRVQNDKEIIDVYTSPEQLALDHESEHGKPIQMQGRELFGLIGQTGCDVGINTYSGHGGRLTAQKIQELLARPS